MFKKTGKQIILPQINYSEFTENSEVNSTKQGGGKQDTEMPGRENASKGVDDLPSPLAAAILDPCVSEYQPHWYVLIPWAVKILGVTLLLCGVPSVIVPDRLSQGAKNFIMGAFNQTMAPRDDQPGSIHLPLSS